MFFFKVALSKLSQKKLASTSKIEEGKSWEFPDI